jgi:hypothetical protein
LEAKSEMTSFWPAGTYNIVEEYAADAGSNQRILDAINDSQGRFVAAYFGHGASKYWNGDPPPIILRANDIPGDFSNSTYFPIVTAATCVNGYYLEADANNECMAEALVESASKGAIAVIAGTSLSQNDVAKDITVGFYRSLLSGGARTLGDAMLGAYLYAWSEKNWTTASELTFYQIFGDPGLIVNP